MKEDKVILIGLEDLGEESSSLSLEYIHSSLAFTV